MRTDLSTHQSCPCHAPHCVGEGGAAAAAACLQASARFQHGSSPPAPAPAQLPVYPRQSNRLDRFAWVWRRERASESSRPSPCSIATQGDSSRLLLPPGSRPLWRHAHTYNQRDATWGQKGLALTSGQHTQLRVETFRLAGRGPFALCWRRYTHCHRGFGGFCRLSPNGQLGGARCVGRARG